MRPVELLHEAWPATEAVLLHVAGRPVRASTLLVLVAVLLLGFALERILGRAARRRLERGGRATPATRRLVTELVRIPLAVLTLSLALDASGLTRAGAFLAWLGRVLHAELFQVAGTRVSLATLLTGLVLVLLALWASRASDRVVERAARSNPLHRPDPGTVATLQRLVHYLVLVVGFAIALESVGIDLTALFTAGAVFAVGIGFAMQNIAQNFVSGLILLVERSIRPGDVLELDDHLVRVDRMGIRTTVVHTLDGESLIVPNSILVQERVKNYTLDDRACRVHVGVGVAYDSDMAAVRRVLETVAADFPPRSRAREPAVFLVGFGASSVDWEVHVWIEEPWDTPAVRSALHEAVWAALAEAGIVIAFPQVDVHLDRPVEAALARIGGG